MQVFTSVLVLGLFLGIFVFADIKNYKERNAENMMSLAQIIGINCIPAIQFQDADAANKILAGLQTGNQNVTHAVIIDTTGKHFAEYIRRDASALVIPASLYENRLSYKEDKLYVTSAITDNNHKIIGKVLIETELKEVQQMVKSKIQVAGSLVIFALLFSFIVAIIMQTYISKRLLNLVNTMELVSKTGKYERMIVDKGKDEISLLVNRFNELMQQVKESQQRKDEFIGIASHELKTPLTTVKGYIELLNLKMADESLKQFAQKAMDNVNKLEKLIRELLDVSKIQSGQIQLSFQEFSLDTLLNETIDAIQMVASDHKIIKQYENIQETVFADRHRIEQVVINLLTNAIKYSPDRDKVIVDVYKTDEKLVIKIEDFGIGIPKEEQKIIFDRFYRAKGISTRIAGFGLGLYISKDIINRHKGEIWVESSSKGSAFYFSLPIYKIQDSDNHNLANITNHQ